jgi:hypothetical protein
MQRTGAIVQFTCAERNGMENEGRRISQTRSRFAAAGFPLIDVQR